MSNTTKQVKPDAATVMRDYQHIGTENDSRFIKPPGKWVRFSMNSRGSREWWCDHDLKQFYEVYSD